MTKYVYSVNKYTIFAYIETYIQEFTENNKWLIAYIHIYSFYFLMLNM